ncbi:MAG: histidinol-phosphate transaminase [Betaproteobacteria bacterium]|nr:histidinol-phosphate transaminase [Betaproteobacteria bacterium]
MSKRPEEIIRDEIRALAAYHVPESGGMVKLDAMENPYRLPADLQVEIAHLAETAALNRYPDPAAARLKSRLREAMQIPADADVLLGNGSDEIIQMLIMAAARPGTAVLGVEPSFVMFRMIATFCGVRFVGVELTADFMLDVERMLAEIARHQPALIFLAYPNNPTGNLFDADAVRRIMEAAPGLVVVDEAYHAFADATFMPRLVDHPNLLVMRTLSKLGLAGLRLGILCGRKAWLEHVDKVRLPYNINVLTQLIAEKVLQHGDLLRQQAAAIKAERARVFNGLQNMPGIRPCPTQANFILFRTTAANRIFDRLKQRGILIKNLHGAHPALAECLRATIGTPEENTRFLDALKDAVNAA